MTSTVLAAPAVRVPAQPLAAPQRYARVIAILFILSIVGGALGEAIIPARIIAWNDAAATARSIVESNTLYRYGFAAYLVEAVCDVGLAVAFFMLLRPVGFSRALLAAFFGLLSTTLFAVAEGFYFAPTLILSGSAYLKAFSPEQLNALVMLSLRFYARLAGLFMLFYGAASILRGLLIMRSGFLPKAIGGMLVAGGVGFTMHTVAVVLAPKYASDYLQLPLAVAGVALMLWLLIKGVDVQKWNAANAASASQE